MRRAVSRLEMRRDRTLQPSTTRTSCRLEPPAGVRRHPAMSSKRTSARWTFRPVPVAPRALVNRTDYPPPFQLRQANLIQVYVAHHVQELLRLNGRMPRHVSRVFFKEIGETGVAHRRRGESPPYPVIRQVGGQPYVSISKRVRMKHSCRPHLAKRVGDGNVSPHRNNEKAGPRLRDEMNGINDQGSEPVAPIAKRFTNRLEILTAVRRQGSADILQDNHSRGARFIDKRGHQAPERPEGTGAFAFQPGAAACERQVLTWERCPDQIGNAS